MIKSAHVDTNQTGTLTSPGAGFTNPISMRLVAVCAVVCFVLTLLLSVLKLDGADYALMHLINGHGFRAMDVVMMDVTKEMLTNLLTMTLVWYVWFQTEDVQQRAGLIVGVVMSYLAGCLSRVLQVSLPSHLRPLHDAALRFRIPFNVDPTALNHWSSYPSDHAAVFYALATTVFFVNRRLGWLGFALATIQSVSRIYLGFHFPSDVIGGGALGILGVIATRGLRFTRPVIRLVPRTAKDRPLFYAAAFYLCYGIAKLFGDWRDIAVDLLHGIARHVLHLHH